MGLRPGALLVLAQHHQNADGSGFPMKVGNERMSTAARIVTLVNRYDDAMVMSVNSLRPLKPRVLVHDRDGQRDDALFVDLATQPDLGIRRSLKPVQLPPTTLEFVAPRPSVSSKPCRPRRRRARPATQRERSLTVTP